MITAYERDKTKWKKTGTFKQALKNAKDWLSLMKSEFPEVTMTTDERKGDYDGWKFIFTHGVTNVSCTLDTHGYTKKELKGFSWYQKEYWNGSSTAEPKPEDWLTKDFKYVACYIKQKKTL